MLNEKDIKPVSSPHNNSKIYHYIIAIIIIVATAQICIPLANTNSYLVVSFILLFVVSFLATYMGIGPVMLAATLSALIWNYFFIPPHFTFHINKTEDILMFGMFFIIVLVNGVLTTRVRRQERLARKREERANALFQLTKELSKAVGIKEVLSVATEYIKVYFILEAKFMLQESDNKLQMPDFNVNETKISKKEYDIATQVFNSLKMAGKFTEVYPKEEYTYYPLESSRINPGIIMVKHNVPISGDDITFWKTFLTQIANALEREFLGEMAQKARFLDESDKLYNTLFNSISHEFRIPVATILGSTDMLLTASNTEKIQKELLNEIFTASLRLNRLIENLLNMSRIESGRISIRLDWCDVNDLVNKVVSDLKNELKSFNLVTKIEDNMPLVKIDFGIMDQVLYNLLFNSCEYATPSTDIFLKIYYEDSHLVIQLQDCGPGFPEESLKNVFKKFNKVDGSKTGGLGLGLSIVKGFINAHKGNITVENRKEGGAQFTIRIPSENPLIDNLKME